MSNKYEGKVHRKDQDKWLLQLPLLDNTQLPPSNRAEHSNNTNISIRVPRITTKYKCLEKTNVTKLMVLIKPIHLSKQNPHLFSLTQHKLPLPTSK